MILNPLVQGTKSGLNGIVHSYAGNADPDIVGWRIGLNLRLQRVDINGSFVEYGIVDALWIRDGVTAIEFTTIAPICVRHWGQLDRVDCYHIFSVAPEWLIQLDV
jgi:hypothetical protein